ncbi:hypothetical protein F2Q69_00004185 [Brassica cretica]|uniref:Uncharacterized protein n=1 Tax=Brassica cretica TaxID=69181 RepID=A0A8S9PIB7_BRACR|nr:hypothetical protein F2Q69_00004185 [Brassica cretica]
MVETYPKKKLVCKHIPGSQWSSGPCGPVAVDGPWMQTYSGFDPPAAETKSHCSAHHGCGYVRMKTRERVCRGLHLPPGD